MLKQIYARYANVKYAKSAIVRFKVYHVHVADNFQDCIFDIKHSKK